MTRTLLIALLLAACTLPAMAEKPQKPAKEILYQGDSLYNRITVKQEGDKRCMFFGREVLYRETCFNTTNMDEPLLEYTGLMFMGFLMKPDSSSVCLLGLGGGYLPYVMRQHLSHVSVDSVEVDAKVVELAKQYFDYQAKGNHEVHTVDGRNFLRRTKKTYDQIMVDAFLGDFLPAHMTTKEFLELAKARLNPGGMVLQNVFYDVKLFDHQMHTFKEVFEHVYLFTAIRYANAVVIGTDTKYSPADMAKNIEKFQGTIGEIDLKKELSKYNPGMRIYDAKALTDQWSPSNLLLKQARGK